MATAAGGGGGGGAAGGGVEMAFPEAFERFLRENNIPREVYAEEHRLPRYLRANPRRAGGPAGAAEVRAALGGEAGVEDAEVPGFFRVTPGTTRVAGCALYREGGVYGIDLASGLAVEALRVRPGQHVLDLCCAPGAKLCMMADRMYDPEAGAVRGTVTGVDVSAERIKSVRSMVRRYKVNGVRMYRGDGRVFAAPPSDEPVRHCRVVDLGGGAGTAAPGAPARGYDRVLVDAECTHDGSIRHVTKFHRLGWDRFERKFLDPARLAGLRDLQRALLLNGFRRLAEGGELVYSTCSFARAQNEDVVAWLLAREPAAELLPLGLEGAADAVPCTPGLGMPLAARYDPVVSGTSGLFIARLTRRAAAAAAVPSPAGGTKRAAPCDPALDPAPRAAKR